MVKYCEICEVNPSYWLRWCPDCQTALEKELRQQRDTVISQRITAEIERGAREAAAPRRRADTQHLLLPEPHESRPVSRVAIFLLVLALIAIGLLVIT